MQIKSENIAKTIIILGIPIIIGQLGNIFQQFADTIMVGQYGTLDLAAAGFVNNVFNFILFSLLGISYASTPVIGAAFGSRDYASVTGSLAESIVVNLLFSLFVASVLVLLYFNIGCLGQPDEILPIARPYLLLLTVSVPFMGVFNALKQFSDAVGETKVPMWIMLASNVLNIVLNWLLIFEADMGLTGAGIATLIARVLSMVGMMVAISVMRKYRSIITSRPQCLLTYAGMKRFLFLGLPISVQLGLEASSFNVCAIFMGWLGAISLAAHQVMCTISTLCFQVLYGIGAAASVMISQFCGAGDWRQVRKTASTAFLIGLGMILSMLCVIWFLRYPMVKCFTSNEDVIAVIMSLLPCFFLYQFGDCTQIVYANALRGMARVKKMMLYAFIAYVVVSIPLSYLFGFVVGWGATGVWMGMPFGLTTAGVLFYREFSRLAK